MATPREQVRNAPVARGDDTVVTFFEHVPGTFIAAHRLRAVDPHALAQASAGVPQVWRPLGASAQGRRNLAPVLRITFPVPRRAVPAEETPLLGAEGTGVVWRVGWWLVAAWGAATAAVEAVFGFFFGRRG